MYLELKVNIRSMTILLEIINPSPIEKISMKFVVALAVVEGIKLIEQTIKYMKVHMVDAMSSKGA